jgi:hypothetical protein
MDEGSVVTSFSGKSFPTMLQNIPASETWSGWSGLPQLVHCAPQSQMTQAIHPSLIRGRYG